jgi:DNA-binding NarL/FixJ family response regulator
LEKDLEVVGAAQDGVEALDLAMQTKPDLVLMDLKMPGMNGVEATRRIHERLPETKILVLTTFDDDEWVFDAVRAGATGYLLKDTPREKVVDAIRGTVLGKSFLDPAIAGKLMKQVATRQEQPSSIITDKLTARELDILKFIAHGLTNADIADRLHLSEGTVRNHVSEIFTKLEVNDRTQAAILAIRHGLD